MTAPAPTPLQAVGTCDTCGRQFYLTGTKPGISRPIPHTNGWADGRPYDCPGSLNPARDAITEVLP